jgi:hypothetical protein
MCIKYKSEGFGEGPVDRIEMSGGYVKDVFLGSTEEIMTAATGSIRAPPTLVDTATEEAAPRLATGEAAAVRRAIDVSHMLESVSQLQRQSGAVGEGEWRHPYYKATLERPNALVGGAKIDKMRTWLDDKDLGEIERNAEKIHKRRQKRADKKNAPEVARLAAEAQKKKVDYSVYAGLYKEKEVSLRNTLEQAFPLANRNDANIKKYLLNKAVVGDVQKYIAIMAQTADGILKLLASANSKANFVEAAGPLASWQEYMTGLTGLQATYDTARTSLTNVTTVLDQKAAEPKPGKEGQKWTAINSFVMELLELMASARGAATVVDSADISKPEMYKKYLPGDTTAGDAPADVDTDTSSETSKS